MAEEKGIGEGETKDNSTAVAAAITSDGKGKKKHKGILSRVWNGIFRLHGDDFEKRLKYISKEEASIIARMKRRSYTWRRMTRNLIAFSVIFERSDTDPAAKAAAATVLASKLGADSGLNVYVGDESKLNAPTGKSNDVELVQSGGLLYT